MIKGSLFDKWQWAACLTTFFFVLLNYILGVIVSPHSGLHPIQVRDIGAAFALPIIGGFSLVVLPVLIRKACAAIVESAQMTNSDPVVAQQFVDKIKGLPKKNLLKSVALAVVMMFFYFYTEGLFYVEELGFEKNLIRFPLAPQAVFMWTGIVLGVLTIYRITRLVTEFVELHLNVDLFSAEELFPIANTVFWNAFFFSFCVALAPLFWLGGPPHMKDFLMTMTLLVILINLMFYPLFRVRHIIIEKKTKALDAFRQARNHHPRKPKIDAVGLEDMGLDQRHQGKTTNIKDEILKARVWPVNIHLALRFALIFLIPTVTWAWSGILTWFVTLVS